MSRSNFFWVLIISSFLLIEVACQQNSKKEKQTNINELSEDEIIRLKLQRTLLISDELYKKLKSCEDIRYSFLPPYYSEGLGFRPFFMDLPISFPIVINLSFESEKFEFGCNRTGVQEIRVIKDSVFLLDQDPQYVLESKSIWGENQLFTYFMKPQLEFVEGDYEKIPFRAYHFLKGSKDTLTQWHFEQFRNLKTIKSPEFVINNGLRITHYLNPNAPQVMSLSTGKDEHFYKCCCGSVKLELE